MALDFQLWMVHQSSNHLVPIFQSRSFCRISLSRQNGDVGRSRKKKDCENVWTFTAISMLHLQHWDYSTDSYFRHSAKAYRTMASMLDHVCQKNLNVSFSLVDLSSGDGHSVIPHPAAFWVDELHPAQVDAEETGLGHRNIFGSEFGAVVMSSFESMAPTLAPEHWGLHGGQKEVLGQSRFLTFLSRLARFHELWIGVAYAVETWSVFLLLFAFRTSVKGQNFPIHAKVTASATVAAPC